MKEIRKRIAALSLAASMLIGTTGCSSNTIKRSFDDNNIINYSGEINLKGIDNLFIVEITNINKERMLYLTTRSIDNFFNEFEYEYLFFGTKTELTDQYSKYKCEYGKVENIIPFSQFLPIYTFNITKSNEIKENYTAKEILCIFESIKKDYDELIKKEDVKKLELK